MHRTALSHLLIALAAIFSLAAPAAAQRTVVTGTVQDSAGIPYVGGTLVVTLSLPVGASGATLNGVQIGGATQRVTLDSTGSFLMQLPDNAIVLPGGTQWTFAVNISPGVPAPAGTGPQSCSATLTITGASQSVSSSFANCPALLRSGASKFDTNGIYVATACGGAANCFQVNDNVLASFNATWTNGSPTVTTLASDPAFLSTDPGKIGFGAGTCPGTVSNCVYSLPQSTILTFTSAHSINMTTNATASSSGVVNANNFFWGNDDGATLLAAYQALFPNAFATTAQQIQPNKNLYLPCGTMFTSVQPFTGNTNVDDNGGGISGCGGASGTIIMPLPRMNCNAANACLFADPRFNLISNGLNLPGWHIRDLTFWGGGTDVKDAAATYTTNVGVLAQFTDTLDNVWVIGWVWNQAGVIGMQLIGATAINSGSVAGGQLSCSGGGAAGTVAVWIGGSCGGSGSFPFTTNSPANDVQVTVGMYVNQALVAGTGARNLGGMWSDFGSHITTSFTSSGATALTYLHGSNLDQFGGGSSALTISNGIVHLNGLKITGAGTPINQTGGTIYDDCGNGVLPAGGVPIITNLFGDCSVTGVADVAGNHALTSGWGTANVNTVGGSVRDVRFTISITGGAPAAGPVLTDTFATPFWATPSAGCTLTQVGGTFAVLTNPLASALSRTGVTWTFTGTPVNGQSYIFERHCANS